ncbi:DNA mismatch repair protein MutT [Corynebacterium yudongzhengii]|uniref:NUDIX domain-containing protein n=1 Tax=Corynebacterium yudongzhengii TaxID=2080740 RepID=A0A2U1T7D4_9CORY|nr:NUDIX domain-containing protein [Corynebacterium yudongzhengii]AWB81515.1 DNA mismatch repair protein MutT [Corynebacterium yudongzhengii]PWC01914.1 NUDIX domain-containing protein [Corynebacterium yudongzhengii]
MPIPEFIVDLREKIGHDPLWLPGITAVVLRDATDDSVWAAPEVLLVKRSDNGAWTPVTGICEPGEDPHVTAVREVKEETGIDARVDALLGVGATEPVVHANGDQATYMSVALRLTALGDDEPVVGDDESAEVGWFPVTRMPVEKPWLRLIIADAAAQRKRPEGFTPRLGYKKRR